MAQGRTILKAGLLALAALVIATVAGVGRRLVQLGHETPPPLVALKHRQLDVLKSLDAEIAAYRRL